MVATGESVPDFELPGTNGEEIREFRLSDYTDAGAAVLVFYPFDFSPVCTEVLCAFRDASFFALTEDVDVFGISTDSCYSHQAFIREYDLEFPLLSDTVGDVAARYGVAYEEWEHHDGVPKRALVAVDDDMTARYTWQTDSAYEKPELDDLRATVRTLAEGS